MDDTSCNFPNWLLSCSVCFGQQPANQGDSLYRCPNTEMMNLELLQTKEREAVNAHVFRWSMLSV